MNPVLGRARHHGLTVAVYGNFLIAEGGYCDGWRLRIEPDGLLHDHLEIWPGAATADGLACSRELARQCAEIKRETS